MENQIGVICLEELLPICLHEPISKFSISNGSNPGDNVVGKMLSLQIHTESGVYHDLIVKSLIPFNATNISLDEKFTAGLRTSLLVFATELAYYDRIQPEMGNLLLYSLPAPKYYYGKDDNANAGLHSCLVLEDLRPKGYKMADKIKGLTLPEVLIVLENIAKFHAASYAYLQKRKTSSEGQQGGTDAILDPLSIHVFAREPPGVGDVHAEYIRDIYFGMMEVLRETGKCGEILEKVCKFTNNPSELVLTTSKRASDEFFNVVIHGDLWINNILFKYDEVDTCKPVNVQFIDFQQCRYSSIFDELHYFLYTSTSLQFRQINLKHCLEFYFNTFKTMMETTLGLKMPDEFTRDKFHKGYYDFLGAAFCYAIIAVPFQVGTPPEVERPESVDGNNTAQYVERVKAVFANSATGLKKSALNSPIAIQRLQDLIYEMNDLDLFETVA